MDKIREQLLQDVTDAVDSGEVTSFWQYPDLLLDYDDHAPLREGMEGAPVYIYDESGAHVPCGMDDEDCSVDGEDANPLEAAMIQEEDDLDATPLEAAMPQGELTARGRSGGTGGTGGNGCFIRLAARLSTECFVCCILLQLAKSFASS